MTPFDPAAISNTVGPRGRYVVVSLYLGKGKRLGLTRVRVDRSKRERECIMIAQALARRAQ